MIFFRIGLLNSLCQIPKLFTTTSEASTATFFSRARATGPAIRRGRSGQLNGFGTVGPHGRVDRSLRPPSRTASACCLGGVARARDAAIESWRHGTIQAPPGSAAGRQGGDSGPSATHQLSSAPTRARCPFPWARAGSLELEPVCPQSARPDGMGTGDAAALRMWTVARGAGPRQRV